MDDVDCPVLPKLWYMEVNKPINIQLMMYFMFLTLFNPAFYANR